MKKLFFLFVCLFALQSAARADNDKPIQVSQLPSVSQQFIKQHFSDHKVAIAKMESGFIDKSYEVLFTNGNKVEFDKNGKWTDVDCKHSTVPLLIIPTAIQNYVKATYPDAKILRIEQDKRDYEIKLSNRLELKFDLKFNLIDLDN